MYDTNKNLEFTPPIAEYDHHDYETEPRKQKASNSVNSSANKNKKKKKRMRWLLSIGIVPIMLLAGIKISHNSKEFGGEFPLTINGTEVTLPCTVAELTRVLKESGYYVSEFTPWSNKNDQITATVSIDISVDTIYEDSTINEGYDTVSDIITIYAANLTGKDLPYSEWLCFELDFPPGHLETERPDTLNEGIKSYAITYIPYPDINYQDMNPLDCASIGEVQKHLGPEDRLNDKGGDYATRYIWHLDNNPCVTIYCDEFDAELKSTTFIVTTP